MSTKALTMQQAQQALCERHARLVEWSRGEDAEGDKCDDARDSRPRYEAASYYRLQAGEVKAALSILHRISLQYPEIE
jgi:hypothetical protein